MVPSPDTHQYFILQSLLAICRELLQVELRQSYENTLTNYTKDYCFHKVS